MDNGQMSADGAAGEIADLNLSYLLLAQKLLARDRAGAMLRLGISAELADLLAAMSTPQLARLAATNFLLCGFRLAEPPCAAGPAAPADLRECRVRAAPVRAPQALAA